jgi:hypothetical protein
MVLDNRQMEMAQRMFGGAAGASPEADPRLRAARLSSAATIAAASGSCKCKPCRYLRRLVELTLEDAEKELQADVKGDDPPA